MSIQSLSNSTVNVRYKTFTKDVEGSVTEANTNRHTDMPCRIQPISGGEMAKFRSNRMDVGYKMFVDGAYTGILPTDEVVLGSVVYYIELVRDIDLMGHHTEILLRNTTGKLE